MLDETTAASESGRLPEGFQERMLLDSDHAPGGVIVYYADGDEEIIHVNRYVIELFECETAEEFLDLVQGSFRHFVHSDDIGAAEDSIWGQVGKSSGFDHIYYRIKTRTGRLVDIDDYGRLIEDAGERPVFHVFVTEMMQDNAIDWLTGLPSMARFHELAEFGAAAIRGRGDKPVALSLDLVGMKAFNTEYGRDEGDALLRVFGDVLRRHFGSEACSRFGEDHYYAFAAQEGIDERVQALFDDFAQANGGRVLPVRGGASLCEADDEIADAFDRAKIACDSDRRTWSSHIVWFNDEMRSEEAQRIHVLEHVDEAIEKGWLVPYYQPIARASTGYLCGEEALARWNDPEFGMIAPASFVHVLEEAGLLHKLDMHMVDRVLADLREKERLGVPIVPVSVNISLRDLGEVDVARAILEKVEAAGADPSLLRVEFTESAATEDPEGLKTQIQALHEGGIEVWMDDFGSGYSSLNTLHEYDFDVVKLDMAFMANLDNPRARETVAGILRIASKLRIRTLAEGVENEQQALFLEDAGCDMLQGYYWSQPNPLEVVASRFEGGKGVKREAQDEVTYWDTVCSMDLIDPMSNVDGRALDGSLIDEFPAGVIEERGDSWRLLRANGAFRRFLDEKGSIPISASSLRAHVFERGIDREYADAAHRSLITDDWERVVGKLEYGTGLQFYTREITSREGAHAYAVTSVPTKLGTALGTYGDVPAAYAIFRVVTDDTATNILDAEYIFANGMYCNLNGYVQQQVPGASFNALCGEEARLWLPLLYRAAVHGERAHDVRFSPGVGHWISFNVAPSPVEGCCVFAFTVADDEHAEHEELQWKSSHDALTGLLNRRGVDLAIEEALRLDSDAPYALALMDIDDFKVTNDLYGHAVGDEALKTFARLVRAHAPKGAIFGRNGGDEMVMMLEGENASRAAEVFRALVESCDGFDFGGRHYPMTISLGYCLHPQDAATLAQAYTMADAALYSVKLAGKASCLRYAAHMAAQYRSQLGFTPRDIAENVPGGVLVHRAEGDGEILFVNDELVEMLGCADLREFMEYIGGAFRGMVHPDDALRVYNDIAEQVGIEKVGAKGFTRFRIRAKDGTEKLVGAYGRLVDVEGVGRAYYVLITEESARVR